MDTLVSFFGNITSLQRMFIMVGGLLFFSLWESIAPLFHFRYKRLQHTGTNLFFTLTTVLVNVPLAFLLVKTSDWAVANKFGVLYLLPQMPIWIAVLIGVALLDLIAAYTIHWLQHKVKWMWMFHLIHHSDRHIDTLSANRHHPGESVFRFIFTILATAIVGAPMWMVFLYQSASVVLSQFNHANIKLPSAFDKLLSYILVTPAMHHVHHHYKQPYTDTNYGNLFSVWDRLFHTFDQLDENNLTYGVDTYMDPKENENIGTLLKIPFMEYRTPENSNRNDINNV
jgi:sterol desaturase/sphingolipid hydroxylase (fatty acid hydroxylase superfamily)